MTTVLDLESIGEIGRILTDITESVGSAEYDDPLSEFQSIVTQQHAGMFAGKYGASLGEWPSLAPLTIRRNGHDRILNETGESRSSLVQGGESANANGPGENPFGTENEYSVFHQFSSRTMPARSSVDVTEESLNELANKIADATVAQLLEERDGH